nr:MAG TPA: hypothetical protein [Caudoviricetes sp.]
MPVARSHTSFVGRCFPRRPFRRFGWLQSSSRRVGKVLSLSWFYAILLLKGGIRH